MQQMQEFSIHTHTKIGDGYDTVEDMILEAKRSGLKTLGISDHFWAVVTICQIMLKPLEPHKISYSLMFLLG